MSDFNVVIPLYSRPLASGPPHMLMTIKTPQSLMESGISYLNPAPTNFTMHFTLS